MIRNCLKLLIYLLICKTTIAVLYSFRNYFPADFESEFLFNRDEYFWGFYCFSFYLHILTGPISLVLGMILMSERFRRRYAAWHRRLGKFQIAVVLGGVVPGGLGMAPYSETGTIAALGFATLAIATAWVTIQGWRSAISRRFSDHRIWMARCFVLLCSAVVLRVIGGLVTILDIGGTYPFAAWMSWVVPLVVFEITRQSASRVTAI